MTARTIAVLTTGRQDWGIVRSSAWAIRETEGLRLRLFAGGMHLSALYGTTVDLVRADGFEPNAELAWLGDIDQARTVSADVQASRALELIGRALRTSAVDALLLAGDRFETAAAALAATLNRVPIVHLHGGEQTEGSFDDTLRNAITKLAHLHLVSHPEHERRVIALGEAPETIHVVGAPSLDAAFRTDLADRAELESALGPLPPPVVIVTVHPTTLDPDPSSVVAPIVTAMARVPATYVITLPNADPGSETVRAALVSAAMEPGVVVVEALGERRYWGLMGVADAMLGNSSSAIIEAPAVDLPAVDVGDRQRGRRKHANVIHAEVRPDEVEEALRQALDPAVRHAIRAAHPALTDGHAGRRVADIIAAWHPPFPPRKSPIVIE